MAAVAGHYNFWNITSEQALQKAWLGLENVKILSGISGVLSIVMAPMIVFGNILVLLAVWRDPLKKLRSSPSNFILTSMAIADLLAGLMVCPITAYWGWVIGIEETSPFDLSVIFAISVFSVNVSFGHMFLLTMDICRPCHPNLSLLMISFGFSGSLTYAISGLNPLLYAWRLPKFKETFKYFWKGAAVAKCLCCE